MNQKLLLSIAIILFNNTSVFAMSYTKAKLITATSACVAGGIVAYAGINKAVDGDGNTITSHYISRPTYLAEVVGTAAMTAAVVGFVCYRQTPGGLHYRAKDYIARRNSWLLNAARQKKDHHFIEKINRYYASSAFPLKSAFDDFNVLQDHTNNAHKLLVKMDAMDDLEDGIRPDVVRHIEEANNDLFEITDARCALREHPDFLGQVTAHAAKENAEANQINAMANSINAAANLTRRH